MDALYIKIKYRKPLYFSIEAVYQADRQLLLHKLERLNYFKDIEIFPLELYLLLSEGVIVGEEE